MATTVQTCLPPSLPSQSQMKTPSPPFKPEDSWSDSDSLPPLPDIVLCSSLSANILPGQRIHRERRRHKAAFQTRGRENLEQLEVEDMMEPLVRRFEDLLHTTVSLHPNPTRKEQIPSVSHNTRRQSSSFSSSSTATTTTIELSSTIPARKRSQTISTSSTTTTPTKLSTTTARKRSQTISYSSTATKLSALSAAVLSAHKLKTDSLNIEDTPEGVLDSLNIFLKNVFAN